MKGLSFRGLAVAAFVAAVAVPAASAKAKPTKAVKLPVVPLQKAQLGSAAKSLALTPTSGVISNAAAAGETTDATPKQLANLGRVSGFQLIYGTALSGGAGVTEIATQVEQYKTPADAKRGLAFWHKEASENGNLSQGGFTVTNKPLNVPAVGTSRYAYLTGYSAANIAPLSEVDEGFTDGKFVLQVYVSAGTAGGATSLAPKLAKALDKRLNGELAGKVHAKPVKVPATPQAGAPSGGPDLSPLALKTTDFTGTATVAGQGYVVDPAALSDYSLFLLPAGQFGALQQEVEWFPTANEASFSADITIALSEAEGATPVDVSSAGDGAQGVVQNGATAGFGEIAFSSGQLAEFVAAGSQGAVQTSDIQNLAQTAANYINSAGLGS